MDSVDLIARENEFKKLNKQLEKKTESLMREIEEVMQKPDIFSSTPNFKLNLYDSHTPTRKHNCCTPKSSPKSENFASRINNISANSRTKERHKHTEPKAQNPQQIEEKVPCSKRDLNYCASNTDNIHSSENCANTNSAKTACLCCVRPSNSDVLEFLYAFVSVSVKDEVLPQSFLKGNVTVQSVCKCLSSKVKLLQEQIAKLQATIDKKNKQCEAHLTHTAELESERLSLLNTANNARTETADMKAKYLVIQNRLNEKERLYKEQRAATDKLTVEVKQYRTKNSGLEARCASQEELIANLRQLEKDRLYKEQRAATDKLTVEVKQYRTKNSGLEARCASQEELIANLRQQLEAAKLAEKEYRTSTRSLSASHETTINRLQRELSALNNHVTQQRSLIANLRSQRALLSAQRAVNAYSEKYNDLLHAE